MTRKELIEQLRARGIEKIWGRGLSTRTKAELLEYLAHIEAGTTIRHLSYSQLIDFQICGLRYYFKRVDPNAPKFPASGRMMFGKAYDYGVSVGLEDKQQTGNDPPVDLMLDAFKQAWDNPDQDVDWTGEDKSWLEAQGIELVALYRDGLIPDIIPLAVQDEFSITFSNRDYQLMVIPDLEAELSKEVHIIDHKTGMTAPGEYEAEVSEQLTCYALAYQVKTGELPDKVAIHKAVALRKAPRSTLPRYKTIKETDQGFIGISTIESKRTPDRIKRYLKTMEITIRLIQEGIFPPARSGAWPCTPEACEYWQYCHTNF